MPLVTEVDPTVHPLLKSRLHAEFRYSSSSIPPENSNFLKGVKWSPDGVCFLTTADDNTIRVYDLPEDIIDNLHTSEQIDDQTDQFWPALRIPAGELVYDYTWYPWATATDPSTCCFIVTCRSHPIHLYDSVSGHVRCSYRPYNALDELEPTFSLNFTPDGTKLLAGSKASIQIFNVERPGRVHSTLKTFTKKKEGQPGIISCITCAKDSTGLTAAGSYSGIAALYDYRTEEQLALLEGHAGGITHLKFSACGNYLYSGARRDGAIYCWDARYASGALYSIQRDVKTTNQRVYFDIEPCGRHLVSGGEDGTVGFWDLRDGSEVGRFTAHKDTVNGCEFHPTLSLLATASGQRRYYLMRTDSDDEQESLHRLDKDENSLGLWALGMRSIEEDVPVVAGNGE